MTVLALGSSAASYALRRRHPAPPTIVLYAPSPGNFRYESSPSEYSYTLDEHSTPHESQSVQLHFVQQAYGTSTREFVSYVPYTIIWKVTLNFEQPGPCRGYRARPVMKTERVASESTS